MKKKTPDKPHNSFWARSNKIIAWIAAVITFAIAIYPYLPFVDIDLSEPSYGTDAAAPVAITNTGILPIFNISVQILLKLMDAGNVVMTGDPATFNMPSIPRLQAHGKSTRFLNDFLSQSHFQAITPNNIIRADFTVVIKYSSPISPFRFEKRKRFAATPINGKGVSEWREVSEEEMINFNPLDSFPK